MGDAVGKGKVEAPDIDTVDGEQPKAAGQPSPAPIVTSPPAADYPELSIVERHHYVAAGEIAKGGMGRVFEARDRRLGRAVAIKELLPANRNAARRFEREARITARLQHPAIIHIYEAGTWPGGEPFFAMQRVSGRSLDKAVADRKTFIDRIGLLPNVIAVADALAYAHSQRVIHRDLKPSNVLIGEFGETVVIDWGLAKDLDAAPSFDPKESMRISSPPSPEETASGSVVGTPAYMPPEQARAEPVDQRADVYALGALLYHVLVGAPPYTGQSSDDVIEKVKSSVPVAVREREPAVPADLVAIVGKAMARDSCDRYPSAAELASDLKRFQTGQLVAAHRYTPRQLVLRWIRRYRVVLVIAMIAVLVLAVVGILSVRQVVSERDRAEDSERQVIVKRAALLVERGRGELLEGRAGPAIAYFAKAAAEVGDGAFDFLVAEAMRPFADDKSLTTGALISVAPDGTIATGNGAAIELWKPDASARLGEIANTGTVNTMAFDPTSTWLAVGGGDGRLRVWPVRGGPPLVATTDLHADAILDLAWSPDTKGEPRVVTAGHDGTARVWRVTPSKIEHVATSRCHREKVVSARFSPDGASVATASADLMPAAGNDDEDTIPNACVWRADNGAVISTIHHRNQVNSVAWSSDGSRVITASADGTAGVWSASGGKPLVLPPIRLGFDLRVAILSPDDQHLLIAGDDHAARVTQLPDEDGGSARPPAVLAGHTQDIAAAAFSADGTRVATAGDDHLARVWDMASGQAIASFEHVNGVTAIAFGADNTLITSDGTVHVWNLAHGIQVGAPVEVMAEPNALAVSPDGTVAVGIDDGNVWLLHSGVAPRKLRGHRGRVFAVAFSPDGRRLVTGGGDEAMLVWNVETGEQIAAITDQPPPVRQILFDGDAIVTVTGDDADKPGHGGVVRRFVDYKLVGAPSAVRVDVLAIHGGIAVGAINHVSGSRRSTDVVVWKTRDNGPVRRVTIEGREIAAIAVARDGHSVVLAGDGSAGLYALTETELDPQPKVVVDGAIGKVVDVAMSADGTRIFTASDDATRIWDASKGKLLGTRVVRGAATALALGADDNTLWVASEDTTKDGWVTAWDVAAPHRTAAEIQTFVHDHVHYQIGDDDVAVRKEPDGKR